MKALVDWIKPENGGKHKIPEKEFVFYPMIKIADEKMANWSLFVINKKFVSEYQTIAEIGFLMKNAPHHLLKTGIRFTLFEGAREIACGKII